MMTRRAWLILCALVLAGCVGGGSQPTNAHGSPQEETAVVDDTNYRAEPQKTDTETTIRVEVPVLTATQTILLPQLLPDGSLYYLEINEDKGRVMYLEPESKQPVVHAVSQHQDGEISELFANEQWVAWVDLKQNSEWSLYVQERKTGKIQKVASSEDMGAARKGLDPLRPRIDGGKLVFMEPEPDDAINIVGIDLETGERRRFTTSGLAVLPSISNGHVLYGEVDTDGRQGAVWWLASWENQSRQKLFDMRVYVPELEYPMIAVYIREGDRHLRIENLVTKDRKEIPISRDYDVIYDLSRDYFAWHITVEKTFSAMRLSDGATYTIVGPSDYHLMRPALTGKTLLLEGYNSEGEWALFTVELP